MSVTKFPVEKTANDGVVEESNKWITPANIVTLSRFAMGLVGAVKTSRGEKKTGFLLQVAGWAGDALDGQVARKGVPFLGIKPHISSTGRLADHSLDRLQSIASATSAIRTQAAPNIYSITLASREICMGALAIVGAKKFGTDAIKPSKVGRYVHAVNGLAIGTYLAADAFDIKSSYFNRTANTLATIGAIGSMATFGDYVRQGLSLASKESSAAEAEWYESSDGIEPLFYPEETSEPIAVDL